MKYVLGLVGRLSVPSKWGLLFFLGHSFFYVAFFFGESIFGIDPGGYLGVVLPLLEFWWFLPLSLVTIPLSGLIDFGTIFFYSYWSEYSLLVLILAGSFFYGGLGYCLGITRQSTGLN